MRLVALVAVLLSAPVGTQAAEAPILWRLSGGRIEASVGAPAGPLAVGSLQKPFLVRAWAEAHPSAEPPRLVCRGGSSCWLRSGHGALGLVRATSLSCNAYFRALAADTPAEALARALSAAGFAVETPLTPETAIGLPDETGRSRAAVRADALLDAYGQLVLEPWTIRDDVRRELLAGMRAAALDGTAHGLGSGAPYAKTGTAPSIEGRPLQTSGLAVAVDATGTGVLAVVRRGTGRDAGEALAASLRSRAARLVSVPSTGRVRVALFSLLRPRQVAARNLSGVPVEGPAGFVGPHGEVALQAGQRLAEAQWELRLPEWRLTRRLRGALEVGGLPSGALAVVVEMDPLEYVAGVAAAELPSFERERLVVLGGAALRFLSSGRRHAAADVCDSTHCAFFVGRGPRPEWRSGASVRLVALSPLQTGLRDDPELLAAIRSEAARPGPSHWTSHCGGAPLSERYVWGSGGETKASCPRHPALDARPWRRVWTESDVAAALGPVRSLRVVTDGGVWRLRGETASGWQEWLYDEAHRRLSRGLGWGGLPSPADSVSRERGGYVAIGRGLGHRVGLCLAD